MKGAGRPKPSSWVSGRGLLIIYPQGREPSLIVYIALVPNGECESHTVDLHRGICHQMSQGQDAIMSQVFQGTLVIVYRVL